MKIVKSSGCTAFYTRVDGRDLDELSQEEKESILSILVNNINKNHGTENAINTLLDVIEYESEDGGYCDQCNDHVYRQLYEFDTENTDNEDDDPSRG